MDERLTEYAVKHAVYHLTDAGKQANNVARVLCSLHYVKQKLKLTPEFPGSVAVQYVLDEYEHSHYQVTIEATAVFYDVRRHCANFTSSCLGSLWRL